MDMTTNHHESNCAVREVCIEHGLPPAEVDPVLELAAACGLLSHDTMMTLEDMAWETAYGTGQESHTFLRATISESGVKRVVGFICFGPIMEWDGNYELYSIAVDQDFHRLGIGTALVAEMKRQVGMAMGTRILLETGEGRTYENARCFYEANDFAREHRFLRQFIPDNGHVVYRHFIDADTGVEQFQ